MSEYQYIEFLAIDNPLSIEQQRALRRHTSRAEITSTSLVNDYEWGQGIIPMADKLLLGYFDAMVYTSNFSSRDFMLRLPGEAYLDASLRPYMQGGKTAAFRRHKSWLLLRWSVEEDDPAALEPEGEGWMAALAPLRAAILSGDLGALFLGWLRRVQAGELKPSTPVPSVPASLQKPSAALSGLADFLNLDPSLVAAARILPSTAQKAVPPQTPEKVLAGLSTSKKKRLLAKAVSGNWAPFQRELLSVLKGEKTRIAELAPGAPGKWTVGQLKESAKHGRQAISPKASDLGQGK